MLENKPNKEEQELKNPAKNLKTLEEAELEVVVFDSSDEFDAMTFS